MSSRKRDSDNDQPPKRSKLLEGNVPTSNEDATDANDGTRGLVAVGKIMIAPPEPYSERTETTNVALKKPVPRKSAGEAQSDTDSKMETDNEETLKELQQVSMETLNEPGGVESTAEIIPEEEVKQLQGVEDEDDLAKNPMNNLVVLKRMFALCPPKDLKKFRLVCKLWYKLTLQHWRSDVTYYFTQGQHDSHYGNFWYDPLEIRLDPTSNRGYNGNYTSTLQKFVHYVATPAHDCNNRPLRRFHLKKWLMRPWSDQMEQFYSMCAQYITHLQLDGCKFEAIGEFREICITTKFPNLQRLILRYLDFSWNRSKDPVVEPSSYSPPERCHRNLKYLEIDISHENLPITWHELFSHYPNLTGFKVYNAEDSTVEKCLTAIKIIRRHDSRLLKITDLDILSADLYAQDKIQPGVALLLKDVELPLEKLTLDFGVDREEGKIKDILSWFAPTLKKLYAYRGSLSKPYQNFPFGVTLEWLEELVMSDKLCESIEFLKFTPNLKKLWSCEDVEDIPPTIMTKILENTDPRELTNVKLSSVVELRCDYLLSVVLRETRLLIETFPNVKKLRMPMNNEQFKLVCQGWRETLEELEVLGNLLTDSAITGLGAEDVTNFNEAEERNWMDGGSEGEEFSGVNLEGAVVEHPNLTNLRRITMVSGVYTPTRLIDCSAFYGFLKLPRLESLQLHSLMKERAQKALEAKLFTTEFIVPRRERLSDSDNDSVMEIPDTSDSYDDPVVEEQPISESDDDTVEEHAIHHGP